MSSSRHGLFKNRFLRTTMLVSPALLVLGGAGIAPAWATCNITSGGGTVAAPANGAVITCTTAGGAQTTTVGSGASGIGATVDLQTSAIINTPAATGINLEQATVTLSGDGALISSQSGVYASPNAPYNNTSAHVTLSGNGAGISATGGFGVFSGGWTSGSSDTVVTLSGANTYITGSGGAWSYSYYGNADLLVTLSGDNARIATTYSAIAAYGSPQDVIVTLSGDNTYLSSTMGSAVYLGGWGHPSHLTLTLSGDGSSVTASGVNAEAIYLWGTSAAIDLTMASNTTISSSNRIGIIVSGWANSTIDTAGTISGGTNSIVLGNGDDVLTLRSGSNLSSPSGVNLGAGTDTVNLEGSNSENEKFLNVENLNMNGTAWTLSGASIFSNININHGTFTNGGFLLSTGTTTIASGTTWNGSGGLTIAGGNLSIASTSGFSSSGATGVTGTGSAESIDSSGTVQGATKALDLLGGNDSLILRTGSNLVGTADGGTGTDSLTLYGSSSENENFLNFETLDMNGAAWTLSGTSSFTDLNINNGIFTNGGALTATGAATVASGAELNGSGTLAGALDILNGGTWSGTSTITGNVSNDGTTSPGNSIGTQHIIGNYVQGSAGTLEIEVGSGSSSDLVAVTGNAALDGTLLLKTVNGNYSLNTPYTFLTAGGAVSGSFSNIDPSALGLVSANVSLGSTSTVTFSAQSITTGITSDLTESENSVSDALDTAISSGGDGTMALLTLFGNIPADERDTLLASQSQAIERSVLEGTFHSLNLASDLVADRLDNNGMTGISAGDSGTETAGDKGSMWVQATGGIGFIDGDAQSKGLRHNVYGVMAGAEREYSDNWTAGAALGTLRIRNTVDSLGDQADMQSYPLTLYAGYRQNRLNTHGLVMAAPTYTVSKRPTVTGIAKSGFPGLSGMSKVTVSYDTLQTPSLSMSPYGTLEASTSWQAAHTEKGAGSLNIHSKDATDFKLASIFGVQIEGKAAMQDSPVPLTYGLKLGWAHTYTGSPTIDAAFASAPSVRFSAEGPKRAKDSARIGLSLSGDIADGSPSVFVTYDGDIANNAQDHAVRAGFRYTW